MSELLKIPAELIANDPVARGAARLLYRHKTGGLHDCQFAQLAEVLPTGALLILNDTKVFPARILSAGFEFLLLGRPKLHQADRSAHNYQCEALIRPSKKVSLAQCLQIDAAVSIMITSKRVVATHGIYQLQITTNSDIDLYAWLEQHGNTPLPPYIKNSNSSGEYQTDYARHSGSVAAPTAGLHFTMEHLDALRSIGIDHCYLTLHVSAGTFLPIRTADPAEHRLLPECYRIPEDTVAKIHRAQQQGRAVVAVGTTSLRALESFMQLEAAQPDTWYETDLYLHPCTALQAQNCAQRLRVCRGLLTNFHQPSSTLFQLISALVGEQEAVRMYQHAVAERYRFYSFGDSCLFDLSQATEML